jgi:hypothetical protein
MSLAVELEAVPDIQEQLGLELEMVVANREGVSHAVGSFFRSLADRKRARGARPVLKTVRGRDVAVIAPLVNSSLDNAFNNLESAIGPVRGGPGGLTVLNDLVVQELEDVVDSLADEGATILNFSEHPDVKISSEFYTGIRAPKAIYDYWVGVRGWNHSVGVDAKAQNGPTIGVGGEDAVSALNVVLGLAPAFIALFANSPFEGGELTGLKENRLTIWPRMFQRSHFAGDRMLQELPARPFGELRDYFSWMFGPGTVMQTVPVSLGGDYKTIERSVRILGDPAGLDFLKGGMRIGQCQASQEELPVRPSLRHLEHLQFSQFLDARIRYGLATVPTPEEFFAAMARSGGLEDLFVRNASYMYIEGRAPGANYPDDELLDETDDFVGASCAIAPSAIQAGLVRNLAASRALVDRWGWPILRSLRERAIADGLAGEAEGMRLVDLCAAVLEIAESGLDRNERWMLAYPQHVLRTGTTGADRAIRYWDASDRSSRSLWELIRRRRIVLPGRPGRIQRPLGQSALERTTLIATSAPVVAEFPRTPHPQPS